MLRLLPVALLAACSFTEAGGNHRSVGKVESPIADANTVTHVEIANVAGTIDVKAVGQAGARVTAGVWLAENRLETDFVDDFAEHVELERNGNRLTIRNAHAGDSDHGDWQLRFVIEIPAGTAVDISQVAGTVGVELPNTKSMTIENTAGVTTVAVPTIEGRLDVTSQTGTMEITVADRGPTEGCSLDCTAGTISLQLPKDVHGKFDLAATAGDVTVADRFGVEASRSMTNVSAKGTVGQGGASYRAHVVTGAVSVR